MINDSNGLNAKMFTISVTPSIPWLGSILYVLRGLLMVLCQNDDDDDSLAIYKHYAAK